VLAALQSSRAGLTDIEAQRRLSIHGPNEIEEMKTAPAWRLFLAQFKETLILMLVAAAAISFFIGEATDSAVILAIVLASAGLGFYQEFRAEKSLELLRRIAAPTATVLRNGQEKEVSTRELVPGDLLILHTGDKVSADSRIIEAFNLQIDEAAFTGESVPVSKFPESLPEQTPLQERTNTAFSGTLVTSGRGKSVVLATGMRTEFGKIAYSIESAEQTRTPLEKRMDELGNWMIKVLLATVGVIALLGVLRGHGLVEMFLWGVSLAVAAVPEALPAVVTGALSIGVYRMARRNAIIRHLPATETLGSTTVICTDKTGTLTKGEMTVKKLYAQGNIYEVTGVGYEPKGDFIPSLTKRDSEIVSLACTCGVLCNDAELNRQSESWRIAGDPTEGALIAVAAKLGIDGKAVRYESPRVAEIQFTPERKMMTTIHKIRGHQYLLASKGAPEIILERCSKLWSLSAGPVEDKDFRQVIQANDSLASEGFRVLAISCKLLNELPEKIDHRIEFGMTFLGLMAMIDPPREEATKAVRLCEEAGIRVVMVTGDHELTAQWVAKQLEILKQGDSVLTGSEFERLSDEEFLAIVEKVSVYSRLSPEHKTRIVQALRKRAQVVAMTGDGINDAPALKRADIGVAMGITGTDVTKEASDIILTDDNFATIVAAVYEGRGILENIRKYLTYLISANIGEILTMALAGLVALPLPLLAKQLLFVNLATDGLPALALGTDPPDSLTMHRPPRNPKEGIFESVHGWLAGVALLLLICATCAFGYGLIAYGWTFARPAVFAELKARSMVFATIVFFEIFFAFSCRSFDRTFFADPLGNKPLVLVVLAQASAMPFIFQIPLLANLFSVTALQPSEWATVAALGSMGFIASELAKVVRKSRRKQIVSSLTAT
jgi:Ca2+-transporting ATPase